MIAIILTILVTFLFSSVLEWFIHGHIMHGSLGTERIRQLHTDHHTKYPPDSYKNYNHGPNVHLPLWMGVYVIGVNAIFGALASYIFNNWTIIIVVVVISILYFFVYNYTHTCLHVPTGRWFEGTRVFKFIDSYHILHHTKMPEPGKFNNVAILCPLPDIFFGTWIGRNKQNK